ncbi:MAG: hypothetical protein IKB79_00530 [Oscillospiraceae bacterium]|nr:hypothetical protein [Oscillospiraceae bacterium]
MIRFENWTVQADGDIFARQFDNLTGTLTVVGDIPNGWDWTMLVQVGEAMDILPLTVTEEGLSTVLTAGQLSVAGYYQMQLKATQGERVRHTNTVNVYIPASLSGDKQWPEIPSEFTEMERRVTEKVKQAEGYASHPPVIGENGNWWEWDGTTYTDAGKPSRGEQGPQGEQGLQGIPGELTVRQGNTLYANALVGTASGPVVFLEDASPLEHELSVKVSSEDPNVDISAVTLTKTGLNLWDEQWELGTVYNSGNAAGSTDTIRSKNCIPVKAGVRLRIQCPQMPRVVFYDTNKTVYNSSYPAPGGAVTPAQDGYIKFAIGGSVGTGNAAITEYGNDICISVFDESTKGMYEHYKAETYTPDADGKVKGVTSYAFATTLLTDTPGVVIDCEYNRDINKAFEQLTQAIISMGGNI